MSKVVLPSHLEGIIRTETEADRSSRGRSDREELPPEPLRQLSKSKPEKRWTRNVLLRRNQTEEDEIAGNEQAGLRDPEGGAGDCTANSTRPLLWGRRLSEALHDSPSDAAGQTSDQYPLNRKNEASLAPPQEAPS
jgi:hypothetical protein